MSLLQSSRRAPPSSGGRSSAAAELRERWRRGERPALEPFLAEHPVALTAELADLVQVDLRQRWRIGEQPAVEEYLARFPALQAEPEFVVDLAYVEFLIREETGGQPLVAEYEQRFPMQAVVLAEQIGLHEAIFRAARKSDPGPDSPAASQPQFPAGNRADVREHLADAYEVLEEIGRGGMGVVYRARQVGLNRLVALKVMRSADTNNLALLARFRGEAEAVAALHHPGILQIYDYGERDGLPYLALELIVGGTLAQRMHGTPWPAGRAAAVVQELAGAVHFAHQHGVIHRDLKPANVLVAQETTCGRQELGVKGPPTLARNSLSPGSLKIADFGLAKVFRDNASLQTQSGEMLGTLCYIAPEQARGKREISAAADIYSLGAILYELLAGRPPFRGDTPIETLQQVLTSEPVSIRLLAPRLPRDLATICTKCLSREPERRYPSAAELASDLARFLADEPIRARPTSNWERSWRWCRRNPALALALSTVATLLLCIAIVLTWHSARLSVQLRKTQEAERAERASSQAAKLRLWDAYLAEITARSASRRVGQRFNTLETVDRATALLGDIGSEPARTLPLRNGAIAALALSDLRRLRQIDGWPSEGSNVAFSAAADRYVAATTTGDLYLYRLSDGRELLRLEHDGTEVFPAISRDGTYVAASDGQASKIWRIGAAAPAVVWNEVGAAGLTLSPAGNLAAVSSPDGRMHLLDLESGRKVRHLGHGAARSRFAFHPPSQRVAVCGEESLQVISVETGAVLSELPLPAVKLSPTIAWHASGEYLAVAGYEKGVVLFHVGTAQQVMSYPHRGATVHFYFVGDGDQLLTYDAWVGNLYLWQTASGRELLSEPTFDYFVGDIAPTGQHLLLVLEGSKLGLWEVESAAERLVLPQGLHRSLGSAISTEISPDGRLLAIGRENGLDVWDLAARRLASLEMGRLCFTRFAADGSLIVHCESGIFRWPREALSAAEAIPTTRASQPLAWRFGPPEELSGPTADIKFAMTPSADRLVVQGRDGWQVTRPASPADVVPLGPQADPRMVSLSAGGNWVALGNWNSRGAAVYDSHSGARIVDLPVGRQAAVLFSPDDRWLATAPDGVQLWRTEDWRPGAELHARGATSGGLGLAFSPDSRVLALGQPTGETRLVDPATGVDWATLAHPDRSLGTYLAFSPDQLRLVILAAGPDATPYVWDLAAIRRELVRRGLDWPADVLKPQPKIGQSSADPPLTITFDAGNLLHKQQAQGLIRQAATAQKMQARELLRRAIELDLESAQARNELAWLLATGPAELRDAATALTHARRAVELEPANGAYINTLGVALYRNAEYDQAVSMLERSLEMNRQRSGAYDQLFLALCHQSLGDAPAARRFVAEATTWFDANRAQLSDKSQDELTRLLNEARAILAK